MLINEISSAQKFTVRTANFYTQELFTLVDTLSSFDTVFLSHQHKKKY